MGVETDVFLFILVESALVKNYLFAFMNNLLVVVTLRDNYIAFCAFTG
jgi:hypothetical protein